MFNLLYKRYLLEILENDNHRPFMSLKWYEKVALILILAGSLMATVFSVYQNQIGSIICAAAMTIGALFVAINSSRKKEKKRIISDVIEPYANERQDKMVSLLKEFKINVKNDDELENLINLAKNVKEDYNAWAGGKGVFGGAAAYFVIPVITLVINKAIDNSSLEEAFVFSLIIIIVSVVAAILFYAIGPELNNLFNRDYNRIETFISDVEEIKVFKGQIKQKDKHDK